MNEHDFLTSIKTALELDFSISIDDRFREYKDWDSLTFVHLMVLMSQEYDVEMDIDTFNTVETWRDLYNLAAK